MTDSKALAKHSSLEMNKRRPISRGSDTEEEIDEEESPFPSPPKAHANSPSHVAPRGFLVPDVTFTANVSPKPNLTFARPNEGFTGIENSTGNKTVGPNASEPSKFLRRMTQGLENPAVLIDLCSSDDENRGEAECETVQIPKSADVKIMLISRADSDSLPGDTLFTNQGSDFPKVVFPGSHISCLGKRLPENLAIPIPSELKEEKLSRANVTTLALMSYQMNWHRLALSQRSYKYAFVSAGFCIDGSLGYSSYRELGLYLTTKWRKGSRRHVWFTNDLKLTMMCVTRALKELGIISELKFIYALVTDEKSGGAFRDGIYLVDQPDTLDYAQVRSWLNSSEIQSSECAMCIADGQMSPRFAEPKVEETPYTPSAMGLLLRVMLTSAKGKLFIVYHNFSLDCPAAARDFAPFVIEPNFPRALGRNEGQFALENYWEVLRSDLTNNAQMIRRRIRLQSDQLRILIMTARHEEARTKEWFAQTPEVQKATMIKIVHVLNLRYAVALGGEEPLANYVENAIQCDQIVENLLICGFYLNFQDTLMAIETVILRWPKIKITIVISELSLWDVANTTSLLHHWEHENWRAFRIPSDLNLLRSQNILEAQTISLDSHIFRAILPEDLSTFKSINQNPRLDLLLKETLGYQTNRIRTWEEFILALQNHSYADQIAVMRYLRECVVQRRMRPSHLTKIKLSLLWSQTASADILCDLTPQCQYVMITPLARIKAANVMSSNEFVEFHHRLSESVGAKAYKSSLIQFGQSLSKPYSLLIACTFGIADALVNSTRLYWLDNLNNSLTVVVFADSSLVNITPAASLTKYGFPDLDWRELSKDEAFTICRSPNYTRFVNQRKLTAFPNKIGLRQAWDQQMKLGHISISNSYRLIQYLSENFEPIQTLLTHPLADLEKSACAVVTCQNRSSSFTCLIIATSIALGFVSRIMTLHTSCVVCQDLSHYTRAAVVERKFIHTDRTLRFLELASASAPALLELTLQQYDENVHENPGDYYRVDLMISQQMLHRAIAKLGDLCHKNPLQESDDPIVLLTSANNAWLDFSEEFRSTRGVYPDQLKTEDYKAGLKLILNFMNLDIEILEQYVKTNQTPSHSITYNSGILQALYRWWVYFNIQYPLYDPRTPDLTAHFLQTMSATASSQRAHNLLLSADRKTIYRRLHWPATLVFAAPPVMDASAIWSSFARSAEIVNDRPPTAKRMSASNAWQSDGGFATRGSSITFTYADNPFTVRRPANVIRTVPSSPARDRIVEFKQLHKSASCRSNENTVSPQIIKKSFPPPPDIIPLPPTPVKPNDSRQIALTQQDSEPAIPGEESSASMLPDSTLKSWLKQSSSQSPSPAVPMNDDDSLESMPRNQEATDGSTQVVANTQEDAPDHKSDPERPRGAQVWHPGAETVLLASGGSAERRSESESTAAIIFIVDDSEVSERTESDAGNPDVVMEDTVLTAMSSLSSDHGDSHEYEHAEIVGSQNSPGAKAESACVTIKVVESSQADDSSQNKPTENSMDESQETDQACLESLARESQENDQASSESLAEMSRETDQTCTESLAEISQEADIAGSESFGQESQESNQAGLESLTRESQETDHACSESLAEESQETDQACSESFAEELQETDQASLASLAEHVSLPAGPQHGDMRLEEDHVVTPPVLASLPTIKYEPRPWSERLRNILNYPAGPYRVLADGSIMSG